MKNAPAKENDTHGIQIILHIIIIIEQNSEAQILSSNRLPAYAVHKRL